jgi:RHS repeat-associated protein
MLAFVLVSCSHAFGTYDPKHGRWLQRDPLGRRPDPPLATLEVAKQYTDGMNIYAYVKSRPTNLVDPEGLQDPSGMATAANYKRSGICGLEVGPQLKKLDEEFSRKFNKLLQPQKKHVCSSMVGFTNNWDIYPFAWAKTAFSCNGCGTRDCRGTIQVNGECYWPEHVNYYLWGLGHRLCNDAGIRKPGSWVGTYGPRFGDPPGKYDYTLAEAISKVKWYRGVLRLGSGTKGRVEWTKAGWSHRQSAPRVRVKYCCKCDHSFSDSKAQIKQTFGGDDTALQRAFNSVRRDSMAIWGYLGKDTDREVEHEGRTIKLRRLEAYAY